MKSSISKLLLIIYLIMPFSVICAKEVDGSFSDLQTLINTTTGKIVLNKDYENKGSESQINISKDIEIDLNGHVIDGHYINRIFNISNNANVIINDSNKNAIHKFDVDEWLLATLNEESGKIIIYGGCITGGDVTSGSTNKTHQNGKGSAIYINSASLTINSGNIIGNKISDKYQFGAGIAAENGSVITINGGSVSYNRATWEGYGGGIYLNNSDLTINGGTISYNYGIYGGGINVYDGSNITVNDGVISNNIGGHNGGGIALMVLDAKVSQGVISKATINGGVIENNTVVTPLIGVGGGISTCKGTDLIIYDGIIKHNSAIRGGGIGAWTGGNIKIYGGLISENIASEDTTPNDGSAGNHGAGVFFNTNFISGYGSVEASLTVGGNVVITGNKNIVTDKEENVYFANGQKIIIADGDNAPKDGMNVGITMQTLGEFTTNGKEKDAKYFSFDNTDYYAKYESDTLIPVKDEEAPTGKIIIKEDIFKTFLNTITFGLFYKDNVTVKIETTDNNKVTSVEYYLSEDEKSLEEVKAITNWIKYEEFSINFDKKYVIYAKITDRAGHVTYISSDGFIVDTKPVLIEGIENNHTYYATQKFTVSDEYLDIVKINDVDTVDYVLEGNINKIYKIEATDKAGNITLYNITMKTIETLEKPIEKLTEKNVKVSDKPVVEEIKDIVEENNTINTTAEEKEKLDKIEDKCDKLLKVIKEKEKKNPKTGDNIIIYIVTGIISLIGLTSTLIYKNRKDYSK